jgi:superfamily II RNA helicase
MYQHTYRIKRGDELAESQNLWEDFLKHLHFLRAEGFVNENNRLTENGFWASKLRLDQPLLIAECLKQQAFPTDNDKLLAAMIAPFVYDGDQNIKITGKKLSRKLIRAYNRILSTLRPLSERMKAAGFSASPLYLWTSAVLYDWARGVDWDEIIINAGISDGDMAMLVLRTADNLRQITSLKETHPEIAALAVKAREAILREPVIIE